MKSTSFPVRGAKSPPQDQFVEVFVDGKIDLALLIIFSGERRAPVHDLQIDVPALADIITVVTLLIVIDVHAGEIRLGEKALVAFDLFFQFADVRVDGDDLLIIFSGKVLFGFDRLRLVTVVFDLDLQGIDIIRFQQSHDRSDARVFILPLFIFVEKIEIKLLVGLLLALY